MIAERKRANPRPTSIINCVQHRSHHNRDGVLSNAGRMIVALDKFDHDVSTGSGKPSDVVILEIALDHTTVLECDFAVKRRSDCPEDASFDLAADYFGIEDAAAVHHHI